jgi:hypothetical protein
MRRKSSSGTPEECTTPMKMRRRKVEMNRIVFFIGVKVTKYGKASQLNIIDFFKLLNKLIKVTPFFFQRPLDQENDENQKGV